MKKDNHDREERDPWQELTEYQANQFHPGYYVGTGRIPPTVSASGNAAPAAVACFVAAVAFLGFALLLFFGGWFDPLTANKIVYSLIALGMSLLFSALGVAYLKKARKYYRKKREWEREQADDGTEDRP